MATGALNAQGVWIYGEDDSEATFSALLNKLGTSISSNMKGRIVQTVFSSTTTTVTSASNTPVSTGITATITPTSATSKIIVQSSAVGLYKTGNAEIDIKMYKNGSFAYIIDGDAGYTASTTTNFVAGTSNVYVETAGSTSSKTYTLMINNDAGTTGTVGVTSSGTSSIIIWEISA